jgi:hypothetical protein
MLGGLGKLAAEGLAHRTEKATEGAGKGWGFFLSVGRLGWTCLGLLEADPSSRALEGMKEAPLGILVHELHQDRVVLEAQRLKWAVPHCPSSLLWGPSVHLFMGPVTEGQDGG